MFEVALEEKTEEGKADNRACAKAQQEGESPGVLNQGAEPRGGQQGWGCEPLDRRLSCPVEKLWFILEPTRSLWRHGRRGRTWATRWDAQSLVQATEDKSKRQISQHKRE